MEAELFVTAFESAEGIAFNGRGDLFVGADQAIWRLEPDGRRHRVVGVETHLGQAGIGPRDLLAADFGPTNVFRDGAEQVHGDGVVWRVTPEGNKSLAATGIDDPNAILVLPDRSFLVSDDGTNAIHRVEPDGRVSLWTDAIPYPNGMVLSRDGTAVYVAQIFSGIGPVVREDRLWRVPLRDGARAGKPLPVFEGPDDGRKGGFDGLAIDIHGRVYIADNGRGVVWRYDPRESGAVLVGQGMPNVASLAFGEGDFDRRALYATSTRRGGGRIWKILVGVEGAPPCR